MIISGEAVSVRYLLPGWRKFWQEKAGPVYALSKVHYQFISGVNIILGPNGAGKSTLLHVLAGLKKPDEGEIRINGSKYDPVALRSLISYLPQKFGLYPHFTAREHLEYIALLKGMGERQRREQAVAKVLEKVSLGTAAQQRIATYSQGMRQKVGIAQTLLGNAKLLLLDEPTAGLDPEERNKVRLLLREIGETRSVILASTLPADANCADSIYILKQGKNCFNGTPAELAAQTSMQKEPWSALEQGYHDVLRKSVMK